MATAWLNCHMRARRALSISRGIPFRTRRALSISRGIPFRIRRALSISRGIPFRIRRALSISRGIPFRIRRALSIFRDVPLRTRRALWLHKFYGDSALLVLNGTSLNSDSALLALNWRNEELSDFWLSNHKKVTFNDPSLPFSCEKKKKKCLIECSGGLLRSITSSVVFTLCAFAMTLELIVEWGRLAPLSQNNWVRDGTYAQGIKDWIWCINSYMHLQTHIHSTYSP